MDVYRHALASNMVDDNKAIEKELFVPLIEPLLSAILHSNGANPMCVWLVCLTTVQNRINNQLFSLTTEKQYAQRAVEEYFNF